jgi:hypothetical protein
LEKEVPLVKKESKFKQVIPEKVGETEIIRTKVIKQKDLLTMEEKQDALEKFKKYDKDNNEKMFLFFFNFLIVQKMN